MANWVWILIVIAAVVVIALIAMAVRQRRARALRERFGPEYDRAVEGREDRRAAEAELRDREKQRARLDIKPLPEETRARFAQEWQDVQERFVDQPQEAVVSADRLLYSVMDARGYPVGDFDAQADLVSVDHPEVVEDYRFAHGTCERAGTQQVSTEDLREALLRYRSLFGELLRADGDQEGVTTQRRTDESEVANERP
jgi:FtsZ-interacting cell division protein ZipA